MMLPGRNQYPLNMTPISTSFIALIRIFKDGEKRYIVAPKWHQNVGQTSELLESIMRRPEIRKCLMPLSD